MTDDPHTTVSIERYPDPACSYSFEDGKPIIQRRNERFESVCGLDCGDALDELFSSGFSAGGRRPTFDQTDKLWISNGSDTQYLVRVIAPAEEEPGHLLFTSPGDHERETQLDVDRMASVLSHDLRNPLDVARARLRAGRELDEDEQFEHVEQAHDRIERIIQDVLTLARGEDVVNPEQEADLGEITREAWQTVETDGATVEVEDDLPTAVVDRDRASRLFENLFRNAVEHGSTGPRSQAPGNAVTHDSAGPDSRTDQEAVGTGTDLTESNCVTVTVGRSADGVYVADDGPGIPEDAHNLIFEPGYSSDEHGTGLGLAIVERIADLHGWSIDVCTAESGGACFEISGLQSE